MKSGDGFRKALAVLGVVLLMFGVLSSLDRQNFTIHSQISSVFDSIPGIDPPYFWVRKMDCPLVMEVDDTEVVTAEISGLTSSATQKWVGLYGKSFLTVPGEPVQVSIPEDGNGEARWRITAQEVGNHKLVIPIDDWGVHYSCLIRVVDNLLLNVRASRILSLFLLVAGSLLVVPRMGIRSLKFNKQLLKDALPLMVILAPVYAAILAIAITLHDVSIPQGVIFIGLNLVLATTWLLFWFVGMWQSRIPGARRRVLLIGSFLFSLMAEALLLRVVLEETYKPLHSDIFGWTFIALSSVLLLYPHFDRSWNHAWTEIPQRGRSMRSILFVIAAPLLAVGVLSAISESLLMLF